MASFTSPPERPAPAPREERLDSVAAQVQALDELIVLARHTIRVFDLDMSEMGWNSAARTERVAAFLRSARHAKLDVIVHDTRYLESACPRFTMLLRQFSAAMTVYRTGPEARSAMDPLTIVDARHFLHRHHVDQPRATLAIEQPALARPLVQRFEEIWGTGEPGLNATVLGL
jgi:hypothetical protein